MSYTKTVQEWAIKNDFEYLEEFDGEGAVRFHMTFGEIQVRVLVRGFNEQKMLSVNAYFPFEAKKTKFLDLIQAFNKIHQDMAYGTFTLSEEGEIIYTHNLSLADIPPHVTVLEEMVEKAYVIMDFFIGGIAELALEKLSFEEWKERLPKE